jgi:voltage-gated potassium channel
MKLTNRLKQRAYEIIAAATPDDYFSKIFDVSILFLILINVIASVLSTVQKLSSEYNLLFSHLETVSVIIFTIEYLLRLWTVTLKPGFEKPVLGRLKYVFTAFSIIDLLAIVPFYLPMLIKVDLRFLRALRLLRLFRLLKLERYTQGIQIMSKVAKKSIPELIVTCFLLSFAVLISASVVYFFESEAQPDKYGSIPNAIWWSISAITSVGYGDVYPITTLGQLFGSVTALFGIALFALPAAILTSGFNEVMEERKKVEKSEICPHCDKEI